MSIYVTDYRYLLEAMFGNKNTALSPQKMKSEDLATPTGQAQLRAAGIDTDSAQYKAAMKAMQSTGKAGFVNIQGIKNMMRGYDSNGDVIIQGGPFAGLSGLDVSEANAGKRTKGIVPISDSVREEMFNLLKKEFAEGKWDGVETTGGTDRSEVYAKLYRGTAKNDRLAAGRTLQQYEKQYINAFSKVLKESEPARRPGTAVSKDTIAKLNEIDRKSLDQMIVGKGTKVGSRINISV